MNLLIVGASGATGQELVKQALSNGFTVTAFVRTPQKLPITHRNLNVVQGDVGDYYSVERAVKNQDVVLSALGVSQTLKNDPVVVEGVKNILTAMQRFGVQRLVYLSFLAVGKGRQDAGFVLKTIVSRIVRNEIDDHQEKERLIRASPLRWTIVSPPTLTNGRRKGVYRMGEGLKAQSILPMVARADVADCMLRQVANEDFIGKTVRIMY